jgi:protein transport protein SEC61 subunit gamma-like protein
MDEQSQPEVPVEDLSPHADPNAHNGQVKGPGKIKQKWLWLKAFVKECKRVLTVTKKPTREELKTVVKISGVGILLIGLLGFLIHAAREGLRYFGF